MITLFGAAPDTGNQGVTALCQSSVIGMAKRGLGPVVVADHGRGLRHESWTIAGRQIAVQRVGATHSRRVYRSDSMTAIRFCLGMGGLGNPCAKVLRNSQAVIDVSGGDSFTDLYGPRRFRAMTLSKRMALEAGRPLILLPQTLGPFNHPECRAEAAELLRQATVVWTRDRGSLDLLKGLLGPDFSPSRHRQGVDMALTLPAEQPKAPLPPRIAEWLTVPPEVRGYPVIGLNTSGLLYNSTDGGRNQFALADDYRKLSYSLAYTLLHADPRARLLLIPHVLVQPDNPESDWAACRALQGYLNQAAPGRTEVLPPEYTATELKGLMARLDWFCGTRMHATIGAFSQGVATLALAYSDKTEGVFDACGLGGLTADLRAHKAETISEIAHRSFSERRSTAKRLRRNLPGLKATAELQMDVIAETIRRLGITRAAA